LSRWGNGRAEVDALLPAADLALEWITDHGDKDGDGYVEYQRTTDRGLQNQGWKDSWDSMRFADGTLAATPIALCEVQGYVYAALIARAHCATEAGDEPLASKLLARADELKRRFNADFWVDSDDGGSFSGRCCASSPTSAARFSIWRRLFPTGSARCASTTSR